MIAHDTRRETLVSAKASNAKMYRYLQWTAAIRLSALIARIMILLYDTTTGTIRSRSTKVWMLLKLSGIIYQQEHGDELPCALPVVFRAQTLTCSDYFVTYLSWAVPSTQMLQMLRRQHAPRTWCWRRYSFFFSKNQYALKSFAIISFVR